MRSVLSTIVFAACIPPVVAGAVVFLLGCGIGWLAVRIAPGRSAEDTFDLPPWGVS